MGNVIQIKRKNAVPGNGVLQEGELGFNTSTKYLYIGQMDSGTLKSAKIKAGAADTATKWATARTLQTDLASSSAVSVDGSANKTIGVRGVLPISHGGTGTGSSRMTKYRLCWTDDPVNGTESDDMIVTGGHHYADKDKIAINATDDTNFPTGFDRGLYVAGALFVSGGSDKINLRSNDGIYLGSKDSWFTIKDGQCLPDDTEQGYFLVDSTNTSYAGLYDNGTNLWIGATETATRHHVGKTYISSGHNGTSGNSTAYISVPNTSNNDASNYEIWHAGNSTPTHVAQNLSNNESYRPILLHSSAGDYRDDIENGNGVSYFNPRVAVKPKQGTICASAYMECGALIVGQNESDTTTVKAPHNATGWGTSGPSSLTGIKGRVYFQIV